MAKRIKRPVEKWGGRKLQATVNGKVVCVKKDPHNLTYFMNPPKANGKSRDRIWLTRDLGKAAPDFWAYVEQSYKKQMVPVDKVKTQKELVVNVTDEQLSQLKYLLPKNDDETLEQWQNRVWNNPNVPFIVQHSIPEEVLVSIFKQWLQDPYDCSLKLGDERIAQLDKLSTRDAIKLAPMGD